MFDLNKALADWRRSLSKFESFEDGAIMELESHLLDEFDKQKASGLAEEEAFARAAAAVGRPEDVGGEYFKDGSRSRLASPSWRKSGFSSGLLLNYLKVALRAFRRHWNYSFINVFGLACGIALLLAVAIYVRHEFSFDRFNARRARIFRLEESQIAVMPPAVKNAVLANIPGVEQCARLCLLEKRLLGRGENSFATDHFAYADAGLLEVFSLPLSEGDARTALREPFSMVLSREWAEKLFGRENPLGKTVRYQNRYDMKVTGVFREIPNFHLELEAVASFATLENDDKEHFDGEFHDDWAYPTYVMLRERQDPDRVESNINRFFSLKKIWAYPVSFKLRPLTGIYFTGGAHPSAKGRYGNRTLVVAFAFIGFFILLLAGVNFVNLATARASLRGREVGIRKAIGAQRGSLITQFLGESCLTAVIAALLALAMVYALLPFLGTLAGIRFAPKDLFLPANMVGTLLVALGLGVMAGLYPAVILSSFDPATALKGRKAVRGRSVVFRKGLLVFQFSVSLVLMIGTMTVLRQVRFMKALDRGFTREQIIHARLNPELRERKEILKTRLLALPQVAGVSFSCNVPGQEWWVWGAYEEDPDTVNVNSIDPDYIDMMGIEILQGRNFSWAMKSDQWHDEPRSGRALIMNESAARFFGAREPTAAIGGRSRFRNDALIGIVRDFHFYSPQTEINPLIFYWDPRPQGTVSVKLRTVDIPAVLRGIRKVVQELTPAFPFDFQFLDASYGEQFGREERLGKILSAFTLLALGIAALGLLGLTSFLVLQRRREIGMRKVMGASTLRIYGMLAGEYLRCVGLTLVIAWPAAYLLMNRWLRDFASRVSQDIGTFLSSALLAILLALAAVSLQTLRAARANPVDSLRYE
jgi:putative ABC transport system permease protein